MPTLITTHWPCLWARRAKQEFISFATEIKCDGHGLGRTWNGYNDPGHSVLLAVVETSLLLFHVNFPLFLRKIETYLVIKQSLLVYYSTLNTLHAPGDFII